MRYRIGWNQITALSLAGFQGTPESRTVSTPFTIIFTLLDTVRQFCLCSAQCRTWRYEAYNFAYRYGCCFAFRLGSNCSRCSGFIILTFAIRGPRDRYADVEWAGDGKSPLFVGTVTGIVFLVAGNSTGVEAGNTAAGTRRAFFRRLRRLPPSSMMRPYSATRARLVLTPCCCNSSAMRE